MFVDEVKEISSQLSYFALVHPLLEVIGTQAGQ
jgi:hypothetical protein